MSENKFTKGEWKIFKKGLYHKDGSGSIQIGTDKNNWIAEAKGTHLHVPIEETKANAKLISAAPDLLEALQHAYRRLRSIEGKWELTGDDDQYKIYLAIKKATL